MKIRLRFALLLASTLIVIDTGDATGTMCSVAGHGDGKVRNRNKIVELHLKPGDARRFGASL